MGSDEETTDRIFGWIQKSKYGDHEALTRNSIPFNDEEALSYVAFATNYLGNREQVRDNDSMRRILWLMHCRDLAIAAGGEKPRVMRLPSYAETIKTGQLRKT